MQINVTREKYIEIILKDCAGKPYGYGKSGPDQFDCSGVVSYGLCLSKKMNSQMLYEAFKNNTVEKMQSPPGALFFYGEGSNKITHVMTVLKHWSNGGITIIGARGGGKNTLTIDDALRDKAFVDICYGDYWNDKFIAAFDPWGGQK